jgi:hypothetical protein
VAPSLNNTALSAIAAALPVVTIVLPCLVGVLVTLQALSIRSP